MTLTATTVPPAQAARALLKELDRFKVFHACLPLAIGIDKKILARLPETNRKVLRIALGMHTGSSRYLKALEKAATRFDLDGNPVGEVTQEHCARASEILRGRYQKAAEQRKAERAAADAMRKHAEKLNQLAEKFSRHTK